MCVLRVMRTHSKCCSRTWTGWRPRRGRGRSPGWWGSADGRTLAGSKRMLHVGVDAIRLAGRMNIDGMILQGAASHVLVDLGWVDLDLGSSTGWWAATVATYCPSRVVEHLKSKSTKPSLRGHGTPCRKEARITINVANFCWLMTEKWW